ncbi:hypothetical protein GYW21_00465 [Lactobacillus mellis]|nr:hypothetical protein [Bombilactobacillus mellis]
MQLNELPPEILESEFPNLVSKTLEKGYLVLDNGDDGKQVIIARPTMDGKFHGKIYELNQPKDEVTFPNTPKFADEPKYVDFLRWDGQTDSTFREDYNDNLIQMQHTINALVDDNKSLRKYIEDLQDVFKNKQDSIVKLISLVVSEFLDKNYYPKAAVDQKLNLLEAKINNLQKRVQAAPAIGPYANPSRTDQYPTNINVNDDVLDEETKKTIDNWNQE